MDLTQPPQGFDLPEPAPPTDAELQQLSEVRNDFPAGEFLMFGDDLATELTYQFRTEWLQKRRSEHKEEDNIAARAIAVRIKALGMLERFFALLLWLSSILPNILTWLLQASRSKSSWYPYFLIITSSSIGAYLIWREHWVYSLAPLSIAGTVLLLFLLKAKLPKSERWDNLIDETIQKIQKSDKRLKIVNDRATEKLEDMLERTQDHMDEVDHLPFEAKAVEDIAELKQVVEGMLSKYKGNPYAERYLRQGTRIISKYAVHKANAMWKWEKSRIAIDENARAHRWSTTIMATLIGGFTLATRVVFVIIIALLPVFYFAIQNQAPEQEMVEVAKEVAENIEQSPIEWKIIKSLGLIVVLLTIIKLGAAFMINFFTRIFLRQLQFKKVFKKSNADQLDSDCTWLWTTISMNKLAEQYLDYIVRIIDSNGLSNAERTLFEWNREHVGEQLDRLKLQHLKLTGKEWLEPNKDDGKAGAIFDSGAPGDAAEEGTQTFLDSFLDSI